MVSDLTENLFLSHTHILLVCLCEKKEIKCLTSSGVHLQTHFTSFPLNIPPLFWTKPFRVLNPNATENITNAQGLLRWMPFHHYWLNLILSTSFTLSVSLGFLKWKWFQRGESADLEWDRRDEVNPGQGCDWTVMIWSSCVRMSDASCLIFCTRKQMKVLISPQFFSTHVCDISQSSGLLSLFLLVERQWLIYVR